MVPQRAITVGPVQTWQAEKVSIWHAGTHDSPLGQRLTAIRAKQWRRPASRPPARALLATDG